MEYSLAIVFHIMSSHDSNRVPFSHVFGWENSQKSQGAMSAEQGACRTTRMLCLAKKVLNQLRGMSWCFVMMQLPRFADTLRMDKSSVRMECTEPMLIPTSSASSRTVTRWSCMTKVRTWSMSSSFQLVEGLLERASLSTDVRPSLNWFTTP